MQNNLEKKIILALAVIFIAVSCRDKEPDKKLIGTVPIKIVQTIWGGNHSYCLLIGSDSSKVNSEYYSIGDYRNNLDRSFEVHKHILSRKAVEHIWEYIQKNCTPSHGEFPNSENFYNIGRSTDTPLYKNGCVVTSKELGIKYFSGFVKWIENSPFKNECQYLIGDLKGKFIEGKPFPLTREQEKILESGPYKNK